MDQRGSSHNIPAIVVKGGASPLTAAYERYSETASAVTLRKQLAI